MVKYDLTIIIVNYHVNKELFACIRSIIASKPSVSYQIIVVDNEEEKILHPDLSKLFPKVLYIPNENKGMGQGNNVGAKYAKGKFLFVLNPDTKVYPNTLNLLCRYLEKNKNVGIVAPFLYDNDNKPFPQGARILTPFNAIFAFSFIHTLFPNNPIAQRYWMEDEWDKKSIKEVAAVPGTAFVIRKALFEKIGGFDEHFFLYFEETDLCKRVGELGSKIVMHPGAKVYHALESSTKKSSKNISRIFMQSRFYFLKKHYGFLQALLAEAVLRTSKYTVLLAGVILLGAFLRLYHLSHTMVFIGDQGWFYLSARDILLTGNVPLVGITASHTWLHQGALWTYLLASIFWLFHFHPLAPGYVTAVVDIFCVGLMYKLGSKLFSRRIGFIASLLYATSPVIILTSRTPYHTSLIPLFTMLFLFALYKWIQSDKYYFPFVVFTLAVLYNLELATVVLWFIILVLIIYGLWKKKEWARNVFTKGVIATSLLSFFFPMLPMLLYDTTHGFPQTVKFILWIGYRITSVLTGLDHSGGTRLFVSTSLGYLQQLLFLPSSVFALVMLVGGYTITVYFALRQTATKKSVYALIAFSFFVPFLGFFTNQTPSGAYVPLFFPLIILIVALGFDFIMQIRKLFITVTVFIILIAIINSYMLLSQDYFSQSGGAFSARLSAAKKIVALASGREYNLIGNGPASQFSSFTMNYSYLAWWLGNGPAFKKQQLRISVSENKKGIFVKKYD